MTREEVLKKVNDVFKEVFDDNSLVITDNTTANDISDWDSLTHITLISIVGEAFGTDFDMSDVVNFKNVGDMVDAILRKISK